MEKSNYLVKTFHGLEGILAAELKALGALNIVEKTRSVSFEGDQELLYNANYKLRTALSILKPIHSFKARNNKQLYDGVREVNWGKWLTQYDTLSVSSVISSDFFNHSKFVALKTKDAIVDQFRDKTGRRPNVDVDDPDIQVNIHISQNQCTLSIDSSGDVLYRRGYRLLKVEAPLNEVLAAGLILLSGWDKSRPLYDPMCGSGTIPLEAAMIACNVPAGILRKKYAFQKWPDYNHKLWLQIIREKDYTINNDLKIYGSDILGRAIDMCSRNAFRLPIRNLVKFSHKDFLDIKPTDENGMMITNPPYDVRLTDEDIHGFYKKLGDKLKKDFQNFDAWIFSGNPEALNDIHLNPSRKITLFNGGIKSSFRKYEMYEGSKA
jgi:23S rRNA (guanine2445-N2)-methyltransferase